MATTIITDLKETYRRGNLPMRLIYWNVGLFVLLNVLTIGARLFNGEAEGLIEWLEVPASPARLLMQPWSVITYMYVHLDVWHILFNMLWLYWFGTLFLQFFSTKHLRGLYLLGGILGALFYIGAFNLFPYFRPLAGYSFLLGASASVLAVACAIAYREPDYRVNLLLIGSVRLKYLALAVVVLDLLMVTGNNGGGHIAHLGGALAGLWFSRSLEQGRDITSGLNRLIDLLTPRTPARKPKLHFENRGTARQADYQFNARRKAQNDEVDRILEKLKKSGYESLTEEEKKSLFDASKR